jgi:hypothetical protein
MLEATCQDVGHGPEPVMLRQAHPARADQQGGHDPERQIPGDLEEA